MPKQAQVELIIEYHVFADGFDDWFSNLPEAKQAYKDLCKEYSNVRLYKTTSKVDDIEVEEEYLMGQGEFPY